MENVPLTGFSTLEQASVAALINNEVFVSAERLGLVLSSFTSTIFPSISVTDVLKASIKPKSFFFIISV